jgi:hypothetical protein
MIKIPPVADPLPGTAFVRPLCKTHFVHDSTVSASSSSVFQVLWLVSAVVKANRSAAV